MAFLRAKALCSLEDPDKATASNIVSTPCDSPGPRVSLPKGFLAGKSMSLGGVGMEANVGGAEGREGVTAAGGAGGAGGAAEAAGGVSSLVGICGETAGGVAVGREMVLSLGFTK